MDALRVHPLLRPDARLDHKPSMICNTAINLCKAFPWTGSPDKRQIKRYLWEGTSFFCVSDLSSASRTLIARLFVPFGARLKTSDLQALQSLIRWSWGQSQNVCSILFNRMKPSQ